jgi:Mor family transcriptional regulator
VLGRRIWERLVWLVGQDAALLLVKNWGGDRLYVPSCRQVEWQYRNDQIRTEYDILTGERGYSNNEACFDIGIRYKQSGRTIERIVNRPSAKKGEASNA